MLARGTRLASPVPVVFGVVALNRVGALIIRSGLMPRLMGVFVGLAGVRLRPPQPTAMLGAGGVDEPGPWIFLPSLIAERLFAAWLLARGMIAPSGPPLRGTRGSSAPRVKGCAQALMPIRARRRPPALQAGAQQRFGMGRE